MTAQDDTSGRARAPNGHAGGEDAPEERAPDALAAAAGFYTLEAEDEAVRVIRVRYGPQQRSPLHHHPALRSVVVTLTDGMLRSYSPDGTSRDVRRRAGQVILGAAEVVTHALENVGHTPFEAIRIELKEPTQSSCAGEAAGRQPQ